MKKILRKLSVIIGILILVLGVSLSSRLGRSDDSIPSNNTQPAEALKNFVSYKIVKNESFGSLIQFTGKVVARQKIDLLTEVNGILLKSDKELREGIRFNRGDLILNLDDSDLKIDIQAAKSQFFSAIVNILPDIETIILLIYRPGKTIPTSFP
jgi:multidrug efflux pump subunit AcrA (membrane-fusion protein)